MDIKEAQEAQGAKKEKKSPVETATKAMSGGMKEGGTVKDRAMAAADKASESRRKGLQDNGRVAGYREQIHGKTEHKIEGGKVHPPKVVTLKEGGPVESAPDEPQGKEDAPTLTPTEPEQFGAGGVATGGAGAVTGAMNAYTGSRNQGLQEHVQEEAERNQPIVNAIGLLQGIGSIAGGAGSIMTAMKAEGGEVMPQGENPEQAPVPAEPSGEEPVDANNDGDIDIIEEMAKSTSEGIEDPTEKGLVETIIQLCQRVIDMQTIIEQVVGAATQAPAGAEGGQAQEGAE